MSHHRPRIEDLFLTRRDLLRRSGMGFASLGLASLMAAEGLLTGEAQAATASINPLAPRSPHFPAKAKRVIHLFMNGGPSHVDTFDPKPALAKYAGQKGRLPVLRFRDRVAAGTHGDEAGQILVFAAQSIGDPRADAGAELPALAAVHQHE